MTDYFKRNLRKDPETRRIYENTLREKRKKSKGRAGKVILAGLALATALSFARAIKGTYKANTANNRAALMCEAYASENSTEKLGESNFTIPKVVIENKSPDRAGNGETIENKISTASTTPKTAQTESAGSSGLVEKIISSIPREKLEFYISNRNIMHMNDKYLPLIQKFASKIETAKVAAIIEAESKWDSQCESGCGAYGLMQIMKNSATPYEWENRKNPEVNISAGVRIWKAKENALKFCEPPEELKNLDSTRYNAAMWEHFKFIAAAYNGGQCPVIDAIEMAAEKNGKEYWEQTWVDVQQYIETACRQYYYYPGSKAEEMKGYVKKITSYYSVYSTEFSIRKIAGSNAGIENIISSIEKKIGENK